MGHDKQTISLLNSFKSSNSIFGVFQAFSKLAFDVSAIIFLYHFKFLARSTNL
jgi:hypothetical protein